jgi:hypothetical protein
MRFGWLPGWLCLSQLGLLLLVSCWVIYCYCTYWLSEDTYYLKPALAHAFWVTAWVAWPLAAWLVIASQLLDHLLLLYILAERTRANESDESVPGRL